MDPLNKVGARLFLSTKSSIEPVEINPTTLINTRVLETSDFGKEKKSIVIVHGWRSSSDEKWIKTMIRRLHATRDVNILLVDWTNIASNLNYTTVMKNLPAVAHEIYQLIRALRFKQWNHITKTSILWNNLYFIGHGLGAQLSGRVAYLLQQNTFWKVNRITGLDPAQLCFPHNFTDYTLDKSDADFVDVIHSNIDYDNFLPLGHIDFFVDGRTLRPKCEKLEYIEAMTCRQKLSYKLYLKSLPTSKGSNCKLYGQHWNGTHDSALKMLNSVKNNQTCVDCPQMGIDAVNSAKRGTFLVLTSGLNDTCANDDDPL
ncbi:inactive pancreatic lipase-related protein 1-like [Copidosoma floridanum]|uniref:inactive pancreatic lipase-related protein 1-like n=1 Tax=Copidosoma floridanum TaxID=29053 RepID=UPI0006C943A0|nr:inactive pancreatic lipase-related protein 1-like [Copidosoma floridanum]